MAQAQMRQNAEDLQSYMKDLISWESDIGKKDENLTATASIAKSMPPPRNSAPGPAAPSSGKEDVTAQRERPIPGGDFRAWDKFDVNAALDKVDAVNVETEEHRARKLQEHIGNEEKDKGNVQFKAGKYVAAIECYSRGMDHNPFSHILVGNRAMAYLKMKKYAQAEADCTAAIALDGKYTKAWMRRATARAGLKRLEEALQDYKKVLQLDPGNKVAIQEIRAIPKRIADAKEAARKAFRPLEHVGDNTTSSKERTKRVLHRIPIEEIGSDSEDESKERSGRDAAAANAVQAQAAAAAAAAAAAVAMPAPTTTKKKKKIAIVELDSDSEDESAAGARASSPGATAKAPVAAPAAQKETTVPKPAAAVKAKPKASKPSTPKKKAMVPGALTSTKFESIWRQHQKNDDKIVELLRSLKPSQLPQLIKNNISPEFVSLFLRVIRTKFLPQKLEAFGLMAHLTRSKRFDQTLMFLDDAEVADAVAIIKALATDPDVDQAKMSKLAKAYGIDL